jgi:hypothetical protein
VRGHRRDNLHALGDGALERMLSKQTDDVQGVREVHGCFGSAVRARVALRCVRNAGWKRTVEEMASACTDSRVERSGAWALRR